VNDVSSDQIMLSPQKIRSLERMVKTYTLGGFLRSILLDSKEGFGEIG